MEQYQIDYETQLGHGITGSVYRGVAVATNHQIAVKIVPKVNPKLFVLRFFARCSNSTSTETPVEQIKCEAKILQKLNHPNIVKLFDFMEDPSSYFLITEYLAGKELFHRICAKVRYDENDAKRVCRAMLGALQHCHDRNIVHRDLKPENFMLAHDKDDVDIRLIDFGFAAQLASEQDTRVETRGTWLYMAPELWQKQRYGKAIDLWSFGVIVYVLLSGRLPFGGRNRNEVVHKVLHSEPTFDSQHWKQVSEEGKEFVLLLLHKDPQQRLSANAALAHPWLAPPTARSALHAVSNDLTPTLEALRHFLVRRKFRKAVFSVVALLRFSGHFFDFNSHSHQASEASSINDNNNNATATAAELNHQQQQQLPLVVTTKRQVGEEEMFENTPTTTTTTATTTPLTTTTTTRPTKRQR